MRNLFVALIACAFATVAFAPRHETDNKKVKLQALRQHTRGNCTGKDAAPRRKMRRRKDATAAKGTPMPRLKKAPRT